MVSSWVVRIFRVHTVNTVLTWASTTARQHMICITKTILFKYIENFTAKNWKFSGKKLWYISCICLKHRLWVVVRAASPSSDGYPQSMFLSRNKNNNVYPCKPQFYYIKVGFKGVKITKASFRNVFYFGNLNMNALILNFKYSETCVREPPLRQTLNSEGWCGKVAVL